MLATLGIKWETNGYKVSTSIAWYISINSKALYLYILSKKVDQMHWASKALNIYTHPKLSFVVNILLWIPRNSVEKQMLAVGKTTPLALYIKIKHSLYSSVYKDLFH